MSCIRIERIWSDENNIEVEFSASSVNIFSQINFFTDKNKLLELREKLIKFPWVENKTIEWIEGSTEENGYAYFYFRVFIIDRAGHVAIEIKMDNKCKEPYTLQSHFYIQTEIASINELGKNIDKLLLEDGSSIEGISFRH